MSTPEIMPLEPFPRGESDYDPALKGWRPKPEVAAARARASEIRRRMQEIDMDKIRPMSALILDPGSAQDRARLVALEAELVQLRNQLQGNVLRGGQPDV